MSERISEILEDAYLQEASTLRRALGLRANVARGKRQLRKVLTFLAEERLWAKGLVSVAEHVAVLPPEASQIAGKLVDALPGLFPSAPPLVTLPSADYEKKRFYAIKGRRSVTNQDRWGTTIYYDEHVNRLRSDLGEVTKELMECANDLLLTQVQSDSLRAQTEQAIRSFALGKHAQTIGILLELADGIESCLPTDRAAAALAPLDEVFRAAHRAVHEDEDDTAEESPPN